MNRHYTVVGILLCLILCFFVSCPAPSSNLVDNGSVAYQKPQAPKNLIATRGQQDSIVLTWDAVDNAELYIVYGIEGSSFDSEMQPYAYTSNNSITFNYVSPGTSLGPEGEAVDIPREFDRDDIYIFAVKAYVSYDGANDYLLSENSDYAEGCFAPSTVEFYPIVSSDKVRLMWNCSNLFSILNTGLEPEPLYKTEFTISFVDETTNETKTLSASDVGATSDPWLFAELNAAEYFTHDNRYTFSIILSILDDAGNSIATVSSESVTITMNDSLIVSPVTNLTVSDGTLAGMIEVKWTIPSWSLPVSRSNSYYTVERRESGSSEWIAVVDEISNLTASEAITFSGSECTFQDTTAESGIRYEYRVRNVFVDNEGTPRECEGELEIQSGSIFTPDARNTSLEWTDNNDNTGIAAFSWSTSSIFLPEGLNWAIEKSIWHGVSDTISIEYYDDGVAYTEENSNVVWSTSITEDVSTCSSCSQSNSIHSYEYRLVILDSSDNVVYEVASFDGEYSLGNPIQDMIFRNFSASTNLVGRIRLYWDVIDSYSSSNIVYTYSTEDIDQVLEPVSDGDNSYYADITVSDGVSLDITLKATTGTVDYSSPSAITGKALDSLFGINFAAGDGTSGTSIELTWNSFEREQNVIYDVRSGNDILISSIDPSLGAASVPLSSGINNTGTTYDLSIVATDVLGKTLSSNIDAGYVLPMPTDINVTKGDYSGRITISWTGYDGMVDNYQILRYSNSSLSGEPEATFSAEGNSYDDTAVSPASDYYYTVQSVKGGAESEYMTEFSNEVNILPGVDEPANLGYTFIHSGISNATIEELEDPEHSGYVADFIRVTFPANKSAASYTIQSSERGYEYPITYMMNTLTELSGDIYTNGLEDSDVGYIAYNSDDGTITINTDAGILNENLEIETMYIIGNSKDDSAHTDSVQNVTGNANRNPNIYDYINIFNSVLSETLTDADDRLYGNWTVAAGSDANYEAPDDSYTIVRAIFWTVGSRGSISFNNRHGEEYPVVLSSDESNVIQTELDATGLINTNSLLMIAPDTGNDSIENTLSFPNRVSVDNSSLNIKNTTIRLKSLNVEQNNNTQSGTYWITPAYGDEEEVNYSDVSELIPNIPNIR